MGPRTYTLNTNNRRQFRRVHLLLQYRTKTIIRRFRSQRLTINVSGRLRPRLNHIVTRNAITPNVTWRVIRGLIRLVQIRRHNRIAYTSLRVGTLTLHHNLGDINSRLHRPQLRVRTLQHNLLTAKRLRSIFSGPVRSLEIILGGLHRAPVHTVRFLKFLRRLHNVASNTRQITSLINSSHDRTSRNNRFRLLNLLNSLHRIFGGGRNLVVRTLVIQALIRNSGAKLRFRSKANSFRTLQTRNQIIRPRLRTLSRNQQMVVSRFTSGTFLARRQRHTIVNRLRTPLIIRRRGTNTRTLRSRHVRNFRTSSFTNTLLNGIFTSFRTLSRALRRRHNNGARHTRDTYLRMVAKHDKITRTRRRTQSSSTRNNSHYSRRTSTSSRRNITSHRQSSRRITSNTNSATNDMRRTTRRRRVGRNRTRRLHQTPNIFRRRRRRSIRRRVRPATATRRIIINRHRRLIIRITKSRRRRNSTSTWAMRVVRTRRSLHLFTTKTNHLDSR